MNPLIKEQFFVSLATVAKKDHVKPVEITSLSQKNAARVHKYRYSKSQSASLSSLKQELEFQKRMNSKLQSDILSLKSTVDLFHATIDKHDKRKSVAANIIDKQVLLDGLKSDLSNLDAAALDAYNSKEISNSQLTSISQYITKLRLMIQKKESDIEKSMIL